MLEKAKFAVRIKNAAFDEEVQDHINACIKDLKNGGVLNTQEADPLIIQAVKTYCRWQYDFGGKGEQYKEAYIMLKQHLSLCSEYNAEPVTTAAAEEGA